MILAPDIGFNGAPTLQSNDSIKLDGGCHQKSDLNTTTGIHLAETIIQGGNNGDNNETNSGAQSTESISKLYWTYTDKSLPIPFPVLGETIDIDTFEQIGIGGEIEDFFGANIDAHASPGARWLGNDASMSGNYNSKDVGSYHDFECWGNGISLVIKHDGPVDSRPGGDDTVKSGAWYRGAGTEWANNSATVGFYIGNYVRDIGSPYGGLNVSSLENNIFISIGGFVPVNNSSFNAAAGNIYNNVEVWGGDCFLDFIGVVRGYGNFSEMEEASPNFYPVGFITAFPLESKYCHSLRNAVSADNPMGSDQGLRPWIAYSDSAGAINNAALYDRGMFVAATSLIEEFLIQSSLLYEDSVQNGVGLPQVFDFVDRFPTRWRYSPTKINGDQIDVWRQFQVNDFRDMN